MKYSFLTSLLYLVITGWVLEDTRQGAGQIITALNRKPFLFDGVLMPN